MKIPVTVAFLFILCTAFVLQRGRMARVKCLTAKTDTIFLKKAKDSADNTIYIEKNRNSVYYKQLLDFGITGEDSIEYMENRGFLNKIPQKNRHKFKLQGLPRFWLPVYKYHNHYYLYSPGDWGNVGRLMVTDSTICPEYMDGYYPAQMLSAQRKTSTEWRFKLKKFKYCAHLIVHVIDPKTKLAVWDYPDDIDHNGVYVPAENAKHYDMIVNVGGVDKPAEFEFEKIDYNALLRE